MSKAEQTFPSLELHMTDMIEYTGTGVKLWPALVSCMLKYQHSMDISTTIDGKTGALVYCVGISETAMQVYKPHLPSSGTAEMSDIC